MAEGNVTVSQKFTTMSDAQNTADILVAKLHAMLMMTYGEAGDSFRSMNDELQDNYMWACAGMVTDLKEVISEIGRFRSLSRPQ